MNHVDLVLYDIKHMDTGKHKMGTGSGNERILENAGMAARKAKMWLRVPLMGGYNDSEENILAVCHFAKNLPSLQEIDLLPLHHLGKARYSALDREYPTDGIPLIDEKTLIRMKSLVESSGLTCKIIG